MHLIKATLIFVVKYDYGEVKKKYVLVGTSEDEIEEDIQDIEERYFGGKRKYHIHVVWSDIKIVRNLTVLARSLTKEIAGWSSGSSVVS